MEVEREMGTVSVTVVGSEVDWGEDKEEAVGVGLEVGSAQAMAWAMAGAMVEDSALDKGEVTVEAEVVEKEGAMEREMEEDLEVAAREEVKVVVLAVAMVEATGEGGKRLLPRRKLM